MGRLAWQVIRLCIPSMGAMACGGQIAGVDEALSGGGGQPTTTVPGKGGQSTTVTPGSGGATTTPTTTAVCFGQSNVATTPGCTSFGYDVSGTGCLMNLPIPPNLKLNPTMLTLYFPGSDQTRSVIPYVGTAADCASHKTYGGWYATNITGGSSEIGLCGCSCNAAKKHTVRVEIACGGIPGG